MHWNNKLLKNLNFYIPILTLLLAIIGLIAISSAVEINNADSGGIIYLEKQVVAIILGILCIIFIQFFDYRIFKDYVNVIYLTTVGILVYILFAGQTVAGGRRWLELGPVNFQPSEVAKILLILVLAAVMDEEKEQLGYFIGFVNPFIHVLIPFALIILQNDLGTALVLIVIFMIMLYAGGGNTKFMLIIFGGIFLLIILLMVSHYYLGTPFPFLKDYQLDRLLVFINPDLDPQGIGYNITQSKIALGSGKLMGKGLFAGTQNQLNFLPEKHNDFIFSVIGEEFGFIGVFILLCIYFGLIWQLLQVALEAKDSFGQLMVMGVVALFLFHVLENIGMAMGLMPITGIPLPFISYGGSSMVTSLIAIGLVINVNIRKKKILF